METDFFHTYSMKGDSKQVCFAMVLKHKAPNIFYLSAVALDSFFLAQRKHNH